MKYPKVSGVFKTKVSLIDSSNIKELQNFCRYCKALGFENNSSLEKLKFQKALDSGGAWWGAWHDGELIAVAGSHFLPHLGNEFMRVLFRGCEIDNPYRGLSKYHLNTVTFRDLLSAQINYYPHKRLIMTTNKVNDSSGKMQRTHRVLQLLAKNKIVNHFEDRILFNTEQSLWEINREKYYEVI